MEELTEENLEKSLEGALLRMIETGKPAFVLPKVAFFEMTPEIYQWALKRLEVLLAKSEPDSEEQQHIKVLTEALTTYQSKHTFNPT